MVKYNREALLGIQHWPTGRQLYYTSFLGMHSDEDVKHDSRIVAIMKLAEKHMWNYYFMREIIVKRQDEQEYEFNEADFPYLNLNDIEDLYLEKAQGRMCRFSTAMQYNFISSLLLFIRRLIIQERV